MLFELSEEHRMLKDLVAKFVDQELIPLEPAALAREIKGEKMGLSPEEETRLHAKCKELGLWGLDVPEQFGGANLPAVALMAMNEELGRTCIPFFFPPDSPNLHMLMAACNEDQKQRYMLPYASGEKKSAIAISEPGAGGDPSGMTTRAVKDGSDYVINGRKIWVSRVPYVDFTIVMARVGEGKRHEGITAFLVDKGTPGFIIEREIAMIGGQRTCELVFDNLRVPETQILGEIGQGFAPMQLRLTVRRLQMGAWCTGMAVRALGMLIDHAKQRTTFGMKLSDRQAIQWWIADAATRIHACRLMVLHAAAKQDAGGDVRTEASMVKIVATELAQDVIDHAMQAYGAMGMTRELPLQMMMQKVRTMRIYEGPSEVHRMVIARRLMDARK